MFGIKFLSLLWKKIIRISSQISQSLLFFTLFLFTFFKVYSFLVLLRTIRIKKRQGKLPPEMQSPLLLAFSTPSYFVSFFLFCQFPLILPELSVSLQIHCSSLFLPHRILLRSYTHSNHRQSLPAVPRPAYAR